MNANLAGITIVIHGKGVAVDKMKSAVVGII
jgi:hypothetical protein